MRRGDLWSVYAETRRLRRPRYVRVTLLRVAVAALLALALVAAVAYVAGSVAASRVHPRPAPVQHHASSSPWGDSPW